MAGVFGLKKVYTRQRVDNWPESSNYGYFGGGTAPPYVSTIDRIDFSSETVSLPASSLTQARQSLATVSNSNYGYFGGGASPYITATNTVDRIDMSSGTVSPSPGLNKSRYDSAAVSN